MIKKRIIVGDIHLQNNEPKRTQAIMFLDWLVEQDFNTNENDIVLLGDLCDVNSKPEVLGIYVDYFLNKLKFNKITILQGNHDINLLSSILSVFAPIPNVRVITEHTYEELGSTSFLFLPYYNHEGKNLKPMTETYSNLEKLYPNTINYGLGHIEDYSSHFSSKFCDTSKLKVKQWLNGHIHTETVTKGGNYLGSPILNSSTESGKTPYIAEIDLETTEYKLIKVPKFLEYYTVDYPNDLPEITTPLALFLVNNSIDKNETLSFYKEKAKELGFEFHARRILKKRVKLDDVENEKEFVSNKTDTEYFTEFMIATKIDENVASICQSVLRGK